jgi:hypothetical protein
MKRVGFIRSGSIDEVSPQAPPGPFAPCREKSAAQPFRHRAAERNSRASFEARRISGEIRSDAAGGALQLLTLP